MDFIIFTLLLFAILLAIIGIIDVLKDGKLDSEFIALMSALMSLIGTQMQRRKKTKLSAENGKEESENE